MAKRALVLRSAYRAPIAGPNSAACMRALLAGHGFAVAACEGDLATRAGILAAFAQLTDATAAGDAAAVYYTGHGGVIRNARFTPDGALPRVIQHLCPTDFAASADGGFAGITSLELARLLGRLTARTANVTAIWDCCFSAQLGGGDGGLAATTTRSAAPGPTYDELVAHFAMLRARYPAGDEPGPGLVRIAAADRSSLAYTAGLPAPDVLDALGVAAPPGGRIGALTRALVEILAPLRGRRVSWQQLIPTLRSSLYAQRPEVEGPTARVPFSLDVVDGVGVPIAAIDDRARLAAGHILGVAVGDRFAVAAADAPLAELTVDRVTATESEAHVAWRSPARAWPPGSVAIALERPRERFAVRVIAPATLRPALVAQLIALPWLRVATDDDPEVIAELRVAHGAIVVSDARGPLFPPAPFPASLGEAVRDLENLATERRLHHLRGALDAASLTVELGVVARDGFASAAAHGTAFAPGDRLALRLVNHGAERRFCNVFDIGLRRRIKRLTAETNGLGLAPGATAVVGESPDTGRLLGLELRWPPHLPRDAPRPESFLVVVTDAPADLRVLESAEHLASPPAVVTRGAPSPIQAVFARAAGHTQRGEPPSTLAHTRFAMIWRDFAVLPEP